MFDGHETKGGEGRINDVRVQGRTLPGVSLRHDVTKEIETNDFGKSRGRLRDFFRTFLP